MNEPKVAAQFLLTDEKGRTLTAEEAFFGWLMALPHETTPQVEARSALQTLEALPSPSQNLKGLILLFKQASLPPARRRRVSLH